MPLIQLVLFWCLLLLIGYTGQINKGRRSPVVHLTVNATVVYSIATRVKDFFSLTLAGRGNLGT